MTTGRSNRRRTRGASTRRGRRCRWRVQELPRARRRDRPPTESGSAAPSRGSGERSVRVGGHAARRHQRRRIFAQNRRQGIGRRVAAKRPLAREHLEQHRAEAENVGTGVRGQPAHLLRRHVADGPDDDADLGQRLAGSLVRHRPRDGIVISFARPKSRILTRPSVVMNTFSGLRSRWTMPLACAAARPRAIGHGVLEGAPHRQRAGARRPAAASRLPAARTR